MNTGDIILIPFPFAESTQKKVRPAVVITETDDKYKDIVVSAVSSIVPSKFSKREIVLYPNKTNNLKVKSLVKIDRIVTLKNEDKIAVLGKLSTTELSEFKEKFQDLVM